MSGIIIRLGPDNGDAFFAARYQAQAPAGPGGGGTPTIAINNRVLTATGTSLADTFNIVRTGTDDVRVTVNGLARTFDMDDFDSIVFNGGDGNDTMTAGAGVRSLTMNGGNGNDRLTGNELANRVNGGDGNDTITGNAGADTMNGDAGDDTFFARDGVKDTIDGGTGTDRAQTDSTDVKTSIEQAIA